MTDQEWAKLTPEQKRQYKLDKFLSTEGIKFVNAEAEKAYKIRAKRFADVLNVLEPDQVPVNLPLGSLPLSIYGIDVSDPAYNPAMATEAYDKFNKEYGAELEVYAMPMSMGSFRPLEVLEYKTYVWPGYGLPRGGWFLQFVEGEYMLANEYDALIRDPSDFWLRTYLSRVFGALTPLKQIRPLTDVYEIPGAQSFATSLGMPGVVEALQKMVEAGQEVRKSFSAMRLNSGAAAAHGFANDMGFMGTMARAPFDVLGDTMCGTRGIMMDMYRQPDKLLKALDIIADLMIDSVLSSAGIKDLSGVTYPLHKGADGWLSQKQFETFYFPSLKKVMDAFIKEGLIQNLFAEGAYNTRLESFKEFPKGSVSWLFDLTDMALAKKVLGNRHCIKGNVPASLLIAGEPAEVKEYCRKLIEVCGNGGGFVLASGSNPDNPKLENVRSMMAAIREYGVYH
ncbi:MAG: hypothetical protein JW967_05260 [Dehalococcoidales bacterium]|nr:hypothetical protein [Dehalococcoidales bacterium]